MEGHTCKNCHQHFKGNYCNHCGQSAETHVMNFHFLWHDIQHGLLHLDKGILFTTRELFTRPGHTIREFIEGRRARHFRPISLVLVLAGICGFLYHYFHINILAEQVKVTGSGAEYNAWVQLLDNMNDWITSHYAIVALLQVPVFAIGSYFGFRKYGYNFIEHVVLNAFLTGQRLLLRIVLFPLYYMLNGSPALRNVGKATDALWIILVILTFLQFFHEEKRSKVFLRSLLSLAISVILTSLLFMAALLVAKRFTGNG